MGRMPAGGLVVVRSVVGDLVHQLEDAVLFAALDVLFERHLSMPLRAQARIPFTFQDMSRMRSQL